MFGLIKLALVAGGLYAVGQEIERKRKKKKGVPRPPGPHTPPGGPGGIDTPTGRPTGPGGVQQEPAHVEPKPDDWNDRYQQWYVAAADACIQRTSLKNLSYDDAVAKLMACSLDEIFPEAVWPPPPEAHQWQRNLWAPAGGTYGKGLLDYIEDQLKVGSVPG